jgi:alkyl sulfatase BDS1-like metallo-beta-lactamase superfamily hydrolase
MWFTDTQEECVLALGNGALNHTIGEQVPNADTTLIWTRAGLTKIFLGKPAIDKEIENGESKARRKRFTS